MSHGTSETRVVKEHTEQTLAAMTPGEYASEEGTGVVVHKTAVTGKWMINDGAGGVSMTAEVGPAMEIVRRRRAQVEAERSRR